MYEVKELNSRVACYEFCFIQGRYLDFHEIMTCVIN